MDKILTIKTESENVWEKTTVRFKMRNARKVGWWIWSDVVWLFRTQNKRHMSQCVQETGS